MFFHIQHHVQVAAGSAVCASLAFARYPQTRSGIYAGRDAQVDRLVALNAALSAAIGAALFNNLSRALARRTRPGNGKKSLLVGELSPPGAGLARACAGSGLRAGSAARRAQFLLRQFYFCGDPGRCFFKSQRHVVAQIRPALRPRPAAPSAAAQNIFESKKVAKDIVEILENCSVEVYSAACAAQPRVAVGVVNLPLFLVAQHAVGFRAFAEFHFGFVLVFRIAVGMPFQRRFPVRRFYLLNRGGPAHAEHFVKIAMIRLRHASYSSWSWYLSYKRTPQNKCRIPFRVPVAH